MINNLSIGIMLPTSAPKNGPSDPRSVGSLAEWAENQGFDAVWVGDHIFHPLQFMESLISLSFAAARTRRIGIGTCVLLLPMRQLAIAASQISTLAILSEGRLSLGVGVGGEFPAEWEAAGVPLNERGARLDESFPLLRRLLSGDAVEFEGRFNTLPGVALSPVPPRIPYYFAARAPKAIDRAARYGDGWIGFYLSLEGFKRDVAKIEAARVRAARTEQSFKRGMLFNFRFDQNDSDADLRAAIALNTGSPPELVLTPAEKLRRFVLAGSPRRVTQMLQEYIAAGCEIICLNPIERGPLAREHLQIFASEVLPKLKHDFGRSIES